MVSALKEFTVEWEDQTQIHSQVCRLVLSSTGKQMTLEFYHKPD